MLQADYILNSRKYIMDKDLYWKFDTNGKYK